MVHFSSAFYTLPWRRNALPITAQTTAIADEDGLDNAVFNYQWVRNDGSSDTDIQDATGSNHTLSDDDEGKTIRVTVSFTDDAGNSESITSAPTGTVAAAATTEDPVEPAEAQDPPSAPENLAAAENDGSVTLTWDAPDDDSITSYQILRRGEDENALSVHVEDTGSTATTHTDTDVTEETRYIYRVKAINAAGAGEKSARAVITTSTPEPENSPATGAPTITGTVQVGEALTADVSGIKDPDGRDNAVFSYQWSAGGTDIDDATGSTYTLSSEDEGQTIQVQVSFTDNAGNPESLTSAATQEVAAAPPADNGDP